MIIENYLTSVLPVFAVNQLVVHTAPPSRRFKIYPLWRAFLKRTVFGDQKRHFSVDRWPVWVKKDALSNLPGSVWTGPYWNNL